ncbi:FHA domain-containing protein [Ornithinimicrobium sp. W1665]|uniref:FHA domain-containing protein n=1 Tax=Ornithinimicrobium sp. W1665 TaxID=3416666 RepID=UPI003D6AC44C
MITVPACPAPRYLVLEGPEHLTPADVHALVGVAVPPPAARLPLHGYAVGPAALPPATPLPRLVVADGPDAGACVQVAPGASVTVGRDPSCDLTVLDPALSRWHVRVAADREGITVEDLGSTNGMRWSPEKEEAHPCTEGTAGPRRWVPGHDLLVGGSRLTLRTRPGAPLPVRWRGGRAEVRPWPRTGTPRPEVSLSTPAPPQREVVRPPSAWSWGLPLAASVALAVVLRMPFLLLFGLMAPAMVLGHHLGERRRTRTEHRDAAARHDEELIRLEEVRRRALADDLTALRAARPGLGGVVTALLPAPSTELWSRAHEPLEVVLGRSRCPAGVRHDGAVLTHGDGPVTLDLEQPLAVVGPAHLRDGLVRSVLLQVATTHPPSALRLLVDPVEPPGTGGTCWRGCRTPVRRARTGGRTGGRTGCAGVSTCAWSTTSVTHRPGDPGWRWPRRGRRCCDDRANRTCGSSPRCSACRWPAGWPVCSRGAPRTSPLQDPARSPGRRPWVTSRRGPRTRTRCAGGGRRRPGRRGCPSRSAPTRGAPPWSWTSSATARTHWSPGRPDRASPSSCARS